MYSGVQKGVYCVGSTAQDFQENIIKGRVIKMADCKAPTMLNIPIKFQYTDKAIYRPKGGEYLVVQQIFAKKIEFDTDGSYMIYYECYSISGKRIVCRGNELLTLGELTREVGRIFHGE
jgi:hypothetical protein